MRNQSILLVTEEPITRYLLRLVLEKDGYQVLEANYGLEAFQIVKQIRPDLLIMDVMDNENDGIVVCKPRGAEKPTALLPALLLNTKTQLTVFSEMLHTHKTQFIPKPILGQELIDSVNSALNGFRFDLQPA